MKDKEIGEIRRHIRRDRSNMTAIYGCFVSEGKEIISKFRLSTGMMSENESDKYFALMKKVLSGSQGKNLIDITFKTSQVADSPEHKLLMGLREDISNADTRSMLYQKIIESVSFDEGYLILVGCDSYDVPFKSKDGQTQNDASGEVYTYLLCAVCPVKQTKPNLHYVPEEKEFHDGGITQVATAPALGFLFPAFDNRSTNIYNALFYTHDSSLGHEAFVDSVFNVKTPKPAAEQKKSFEALLSTSLKEECNLEVVQAVHDQICQRIELHKESKEKEPLLISKEQVKTALTACGVSEEHMAKFSVEYDEIFGFEADLHPKNIVDNRKFEIKTPDVSIKVAPDRADLIETRVIGGVEVTELNGGRFTIIAGVFSLLAIGAYLLCYVLVTERVIPESEGERQGSVKELVVGALKNRALISIIAASVLMLISQFTLQQMANYVYPDYYANTSAQSASTLAMLVGMIIAAALTKPLVGFFGKSEISALTSVIAAVISFILFFIRPENVWVYVFFNFFACCNLF